MKRTRFTRGWQHRPKANPFAELAGVDAPWRNVTLPHDAMLHRRRDPGSTSETAYFPGGVDEYRIDFSVPVEHRDKRVLLEFEGAYRTPMVYVNGSFAGQWAYGYTGFAVPLNDHLRYGEENTVRVETRDGDDSRWYSGAGLYRPVHLLIGELVHVALDGLRLRTVHADADRALLEITTLVENHDREPATLRVAVELRDAADQPVGAVAGPVTVLPGEPALVRQRIAVRFPRLWSPDSPALYSATVRLSNGDTERVTFGIRTIDVDPEQGLRISGKTVLLRGACIHHDNGVLGAATIARADERRVELLKDAGFNAIRSAHNPMSRAMLDACDRIGVLVMDEAFDQWTQVKSDHDHALEFPQWWERDLEAMVGKDFNHPSVVMYSIGNEIPEVGGPHGAVWSRRLAEKLRALDGTRPITNGVNGALAVMDEVLANRPERSGDGINTMMAQMGEAMRALGASDLVTERTEESFAVLDVAGMNYMDGRYEADRDRFPGRVIVGSETFPAGIDQLWRLVLDNSHVIGDFTWTGWDYLGEVGIGRVWCADDRDEERQLAAPYPWLTAWCGDLDITGHRRPASYFREIVYGLRTDPYIAVQRPERHGRALGGTPWSWTDSVGSWSWHGAEGRPVTVEVYADADEVELLLDRRSLGSRPVTRYRAVFDVIYQPGELVALARRAGTEVRRHALRTATGSPQITATADREVIAADDDDDLVFVGIALTDSAGTEFIRHDRLVTVTVAGPAVLQGLGSAAPRTEESFLDAEHTTFDGRALAVVRPTGPGEITVTVQAEDCADAAVRISAVRAG